MGSRGLSFVAAALAAAATFLPVSPAAAHDVRVGSFPASGETLSSTQREFVLPSPGAEEPAEVLLRSLRSGSAVAPAAPPVLRRGQTVWFPPTLDHGTYMLEWSFRSGGRTVRESIYFDVSRPSHDVLMLAGSPSPPLAVAAASALMLVAAVSSRFRRVRLLMPVLAAVPLLPPLAGQTSLLAALVPVALASLAAAYGPFLPAAAVAAALMMLPLSFSPAQVALWVSALLVLMAVAPARRVLSLSVLAAVPLLLVRYGPALLVGFRGAVLVAAAVALSAAAVALALGRGGDAVLAPVVSVGASVWLLVALAPPNFVTSDAPSSAVSPESCFGRGDYVAVQRCLEVSFSLSAFEEGVHAALSGLDRLMREVPQARFHCHVTSHAIGRAAFDMAGDVPSAFLSGFDVCDFGFYHGVIEASAAGMDDGEFSDLVRFGCEPLASGEEVPRSAESLGRTAEKRIGGPIFFMHCTHGLGHAAARRTNNDMPAALAFCDILRDAPMPERLRPAALNGCGTGVTMEWFAVTGLVQDPSLVASPAVSRQRDVCFLIDPAWQPECFEYVGNTLDASRPESSLMELAGWCAATPYPFSCAHGLMRAAAGTSVSPEGSLRVCSVAVPDRVDDCMFEFLVTVATTIHYTPSAVDAACAALPASFSSGPGSLCVRAREESADVLAAGGTLLPG